MSDLRVFVLSCLASAGLVCVAAAYGVRPDRAGAAVTIDIAPPADDRHTDPNYSASARVTILADLTNGITPPLPPALTARGPGADPMARTMATARAIAVAARLKESLTPEMLNAFDLFIYVSKAARGPLAQRMYVFRKQPGGRLALLHDWPASTGREKREISPRGRRSFTATPPGYYELDPDRMYRSYMSRSWDQSMPYAMFFNWERRGSLTGLAIHAASGRDIARLGRRASAGCVHLSPENARMLFELIRDEYQGQVPRFAYNARTRTMSNDGAFMHDAKGGLKMADGYKVLVRIEDYAGGVAALF
jgi:lipoprotein-anchoring transpeptidase ErfK/SrfK